MINKVIAWFQRRREKRQSALMPERNVVVRFDDTHIEIAYPGGELQVIAWPDVRSIAIETNDSGPWGTDLWWVLEHETGRCAYPGGATGDREASEEYSKRFPGFSDIAVISAMGCTSNARFVCWQR